MSGEDIDNPQRVNLTTPAGLVSIQTSEGPMAVDMTRLAEVAAKLGTDAYDTLEIPAFRDARGKLVPLYEGVKIARRNGG